MKSRHELKDGRALLIREAEGADADALLTYLGAVSGESDNLTFGPGEFEPTREEEARFLEQSRASGRQLCLLALVDGEVVGALTFLSGYRKRTEHAGEFGMSVRRAFWGLGVGAHLLDALLGWARAGGAIRKVNLLVRTDNARAINLYARKGFAVEGTLSKGVCVDGTFYDLHAMGLEL